jgi:hypothetical protein
LRGASGRDSPLHELHPAASASEPRSNEIRAVRFRLILLTDPPRQCPFFAKALLVFGSDSGHLRLGFWSSSRWSLLGESGEKALFKSFALL